MERLVPELDPTVIIIKKYFPDVRVLPPAERPRNPTSGHTSAPIYFAFSFKTDAERTEKRYLDAVDEQVLGVNHWGGAALGQINSRYHDECGLEKYCEQHGRFKLPAHVMPSKTLAPINWKGSTAEVISRFNEWFETNLDLPLSLNSPNTPRYATLVFSRLYYMRGIKHQFCFPQGCKCYLTQEFYYGDRSRFNAGNYNNPLQADGYALYYKKGFAIVIPSNKFLDSDLLWARVRKEEQIECSKNINMTSGWNNIKLDTKMTEENTVRFQFLQALATLSELNNKVPGVSKELARSDLFTRFHLYDAVNDSDYIYPRAARRFRATRYVWQMVNNVLRMKLSGKWEKKSLWLGSLPKDFNETTINSYIWPSIMNKLRNFQFLADSRTCFLNFNEAKDCKLAYDLLQNKHGMKVEFAKKKQNKVSKKGKNNDHRQIGKCFRCNVKGHKDDDCYYTGSILPIEIWFQILKYMNLSRLGKISKICKYWNNVAFTYWKTIVPLTHIHSMYAITPLHAATWLENIKLIKFLINTGPSDWLNAQDQLGHTPLHYAYALQNKTIVKELKSRGCKEYIVDKEGHKPEAMMHIQEKLCIRSDRLYYDACRQRTKIHLPICSVLLPDRIIPINCVPRTKPKSILSPSDWTYEDINAAFKDYGVSDHAISLIPRPLIDNETMLFEWTNRRQDLKDLGISTSDIILIEHFVQRFQSVREQILIGRHSHNSTNIAKLRKDQAFMHLTSLDQMQQVHRKFVKVPPLGKILKVDGFNDNNQHLFISDICLETWKMYFEQHNADNVHLKVAPVGPNGIGKSALGLLLASTAFMLRKPLMYLPKLQLSTEADRLSILNCIYMLNADLIEEIPQLEDFFLNSFKLDKYQGLASPITGLSKLKGAVFILDNHQDIFADGSAKDLVCKYGAFKNFHEFQSCNLCMLIGVSLFHVQSTLGDYYRSSLLYLVPVSQEELSAFVSDPLSPASHDPELFAKKKEDYQDMIYKQFKLYRPIIELYKSLTGKTLSSLHQTLDENAVLERYHFHQQLERLKILHGAELLHNTKPFQGELPPSLATDLLIDYGLAYLKDATPYAVNTLAELVISNNYEASTKKKNSR